jgi:hypothetical protein
MPAKVESVSLLAVGRKLACSMGRRRFWDIIVNLGRKGPLHMHEADTCRPLYEAFAQEAMWREDITCFSLL